MKTAIIIGATSGIGREVAVRLVEDGWKVGITGRRTDALEAFRSQYGVDKVFFPQWMSPVRIPSRHWRCFWTQKTRLYGRCRRYAVLVHRSGYHLHWRFLSGCPLWYQPCREAREAIPSQCQSSYRRAVNIPSALIAIKPQLPCWFAGACSISINGNLPEEILDITSNFAMMGFQCEVTAVYELHHGIRQVALKGFGSGRDE